MRKIFTMVLVFVLVVSSATPCHARKHSKQTHVRYMDGSWYCYDANTRLLYIETDDGNLWTVKADCPQLNRMHVKVKFDTQGTKRVTDDIILKVFY